MATEVPTPRSARRGREARQAARLARAVDALPYLTRTLPPVEVEEILRQMEVGAEKPKPKSIFQKGDKVRVVEGPFVNFTGTIEDMSPERGKLKVMVQIFGRLTPVELEYYQVERM